MASVQDFFVCEYEYDYLTDIEQYNDMIDKKLESIESYTTEKDIALFKQHYQKILDFDYEKLNSIGSKITLYQKQKKFQLTRKLQKEYKKLFCEYQELGNYEFRTTGKEKILLLFFISYEDFPQIYRPSSLYRFLSKTTIVRNKKFFPITDDMILEIFQKEPDLYRESLFIDYPVDMMTGIGFTTNVLQSYMDQKYPLKLKHTQQVLEKDIECGQSKHGMLRGLVHMIGYTGYGGMEEDEYIMKIFNSGFLEIQFKDRNSSSGIFTTILGNDNDIEKIYERDGIFLIISLSALEDFDYHAGFHSMGTRKPMDFYKNICYKCDDELDRYSAAERAYMAMALDKFDNFYELIFSSDINIKKYVEEIHVKGKKLYEKLTSSSIIPDWVKVLITDVEDKEKVYRKNCTGKAPKPISKKKFNVLVEKISKRENMTDIPKINYDSINTKRKINLLYEQISTSTAWENIVPIPK
jgi:hypothetical protein